MKKFLSISAALIFAIFIGLQTPYVVRSSEVFCRTSPPQAKHCMLIKRKSPNDLGYKPFFSTARPARFFAFEVDIDGEKIISDFLLRAYLGHKEDRKNKKYRNSFEQLSDNCISESADHDLILITGKKTSGCWLFRENVRLSYYSAADKNARLTCGYNRRMEPEKGLQPNCRYSGYHSRWTWSITIPTEHLEHWLPIVNAGKKHFDENFEHIDHPVIKIPFI